MFANTRMNVVAALLTGLVGLGLGTWHLWHVTTASAAPPPTPKSQAVDSAAGSTLAPANPDALQWGGLAGQFVFQGTPPKARVIAVYRENDGSQVEYTVPDESLLVDPTTRGIKHVVVYPRVVSRIHEAYKGAQEMPVVVTYRQCRFEPHVIAVGVNQPLTIRNLDPVAHICVMRPSRSEETNCLIGSGEEAQVRFRHAEHLPVRASCSFHPWMTAYVLPLNNPYVGISDTHGSFYMAGLPAGEEIEFQVWHEKSRGLYGTLAAKPEWTHGRFRVTIPPGDVKDLGEIRIPATAFDRESPGGIGRPSNVVRPRIARDAAGDTDIR